MEQARRELNMLILSYFSITYSQIKAKHEPKSFY